MGSLSGTITLLAVSSGTCTLQVADGNGQSQDIVLTALTSGTVTEFTSSPLSSSAVSMAAGGGALWAIESNKKLAKITTAGALAESSALALSNAPTDIAYGPDGNLWILEGSDVAKVSTSGALLSESAPAFSGVPSAIISGADGKLHLAEATNYGCNLNGTGGTELLATLTTTGSLSEQTVYTSNGSNFFCNSGGIAGSSSTFVMTFPYWNVCNGCYAGGNNNYPVNILSSSGSYSGGSGSFSISGQPMGFNNYGSASLRNITLDSTGGQWLIVGAFNQATLGGGATYVIGLGTVRQTLPANGYSIVGDANGNVWAGGGTSILKIQVANGSTTTYANGITAAQIMVVGPDGNIWYVGGTRFGYISP